ncbi:hypothetical protein [Paraferrimonas sedimenticola]|uniref:Uncharacterized protein n=1 Tax=Paraferrimonas sedimenticola TaxID=375674 RepID=A0AA37RUZ0_9GAMM|nr:hypothetical protein [Paraferrimonas sedimenticola]GLP95032.1 hypothetical protein GCM10007895_03380 [Paraferrimonas sedimenticola]
MNRALVFELSSMSLLAMAGVLLVANQLPGWGLITSAGILALVSISLRAHKAKSQTVAATVQG